jgi:hypothetical protein
MKDWNDCTFLSLSTEELEADARVKAGRLGAAIVIVVMQSDPSEGGYNSALEELRRVSNVATGRVAEQWTKEPLPYWELHLCELSEGVRWPEMEQRTWFTITGIDSSDD